MSRIRDMFKLAVLISIPVWGFSCNSDRLDSTVEESISAQGLINECGVSDTCTIFYSSLAPNSLKLEDWQCDPELTTTYVIEDKVITSVVFENTDFYCR